MKRLFLFPVLGCLSLWASATRLELQAGFPNLLSIRLDRPLNEQVRLGLGFGAIPGTFFLAFYRPSFLSWNISSDYQIAVTPDINALALGAHAQWKPGTGRSFFRFEIVVNVVDALAKAYVVNRNSQYKAPYLDFEVTAVLPRLMLTYGTRLFHGSEWECLGGVGLTVLFARQVLAQTTGPAAAYANAAPSVSASIQDGLTTAEAEFQAAVAGSPASLPLLPAIWVSTAW